jgi:hypothetical protein
VIAPDYKKLLLDWMLDKNQPLNTVTNELFRKLVHYLNPKVEVVGKDKLANFIACTARDFRRKLKTALTGVPLSTTLDGWTSIANALRHIG